MAKTPVKIEIDGYKEREVLMVTYEFDQTTDVEGEVNGLMTYDRKEIKIDEAKVRAANQAVINELK